MSGLSPRQNGGYAFDRARLDAEGLPRLLESLSPSKDVRFNEHGNSQTSCPACGKAGKFSLTRKPYGWVGQCWSCGLKGDVYKIYGLLNGIDWKQDFEEILRRLSEELGIALLDGKNSSPTWIGQAKRDQGNPLREDTLWQEQAAAEARTKKRKAWPYFVESPHIGCTNVAKLRAIPVEGIRLAHSRGTLRFTHWRNQPCWVLLSHDGTCAEVRRMDGKKFVNVKALALPGSEKKHCLLGEHLLGDDPDPCFLVEGAPDWLAACWLTSFATRQAEAPRWVPLGFLGANCSFTPAQLRKLRRRQMRVFVHADEAGRKGSDRWADALIAEGCTVELVSIESFGQILPDGNPVKDLNDALVANVANLDAFSLEAVQP